MITGEDLKAGNECVKHSQGGFVPICQSSFDSQILRFDVCEPENHLYETYFRLIVSNK